MKQVTHPVEWVGWTAVGMLVLAAGMPALGATRPAGDDPFDRYLKEHGFWSVRREHLKRKLRRTGPTDRSAAAALWETYVELADRAPDATTKRRLLDQAAALRKERGLDTSAAFRLRMARTTSEKAQRLADQWIDDPSRSAARREALALLRESGAALKAIHDDSRKAMDQYVAAHPQLTADQLEREKRYAELEQRMAESLYFSAWTHYYLARVSEDVREADRAADAAVQGFAEFTGGTTANEMDVEPAMLRRAHMVGATIGLAAAQAVRSHMDVAMAILDVVLKASPRGDLYKETVYWRLRILCTPGTPSALSAAALAGRDYLDGLGRSKTLDRWDLAIVRWTARCFLAVARQGKDAQALREGKRLLSVLVRRRRMQDVHELQTRYDIEPGEADGFHLWNMRAQKRYDEARQQSSQRLYAEAGQLFERALAQADAEEHLREAGDGWYLLAWCQRQLGRHGKAAASFLRASRWLGNTPRGADAAVMACRSWLDRLKAKPDPAIYRHFVDAVATARRRYAGSSALGRLPYYEAMARQQIGGDVLASVADLLRVPKTSPRYLATRISAVRLLVDVASRPTTTPEQAEPYWAKAATVLNDLRTELNARTGPEAKTPAHTLAMVNVDTYLMRVLLRTGHEDYTRAEAVLNELDTQVEAAGDKAASLRPYVLLWRVRIALGRGQLDPARKTALRLARKWPHSDATTDALNRLGQALDEATAGAATRANKGEEMQRLGQAIETYERLRDALVRRQRSGGAPQVEKDLGEVVRRLGHRHFAMAEEFGQRKHADKALACLSEAHKHRPNNEQVLRELGICRARAGQWKESLACWRQLALGLKPGGTGWFEAKYYIVDLLMRIGEMERAQRVLTQLSVLHPQLGGEPWAAKFRGLQDQLRRIGVRR